MSRYNCAWACSGGTMVSRAAAARKRLIALGLRGGGGAGMVGVAGIMVLGSHKAGSVQMVGNLSVTILFCKHKLRFE